MKLEPVEEMSQKIDYAKKRWGCTLYYYMGGGAKEGGKESYGTG